MRHRRDHAIGEHVIEIRRTRRCRIPEITHLNWCGPQRENLLPCAARIALEIDENFDAVVAYSVGDGVVAGICDTNKIIKRGDHAVTERAVVFRAVTVANNFEAIAIVHFEHFGQQDRRCVMAEVRRHIADFDFFRPRHEGLIRAVQRAHRNLGDQVARIAFSSFAHVVVADIHAKQQKWRN